MTAEKTKSVTADEFFEMKDLPECCELINGEIMIMPHAPTYNHNGIAEALGMEIMSYILRNKRKCRLFHAPADVYLDNDNVVQPDIFVTCRPRERISGHIHRGAPDWVIEIASPNGTSRDYITKERLYRKYGVREYWIVNPMDENVTVYYFEKNKDVELFSFDDSITVNIYAEAEEKLILRINDYRDEFDYD